MTKGDQTREMIMQCSAPVFNRLGYSGAALSDIMAATGLEKGGIYNHFRSKEELAVETFDYAIHMVRQALLAAVRDRQPGLDQLEALLDYYRTYVSSPPIAGGCPLLNTAVESDDANPVLRLRAQKAMARLRRLLRRMLEQGLARGQVRSDLDPEAATSFLIASLEGGIMLARLYGNEQYMLDVVDSLKRYVACAIRA
jgi:AcrR family transcriptional regulator